MAWETVVSTG